MLTFWENDWPSVLSFLVSFKNFTLRWQNLKAGKYSEVAATNRTQAVKVNAYLGNLDMGVVKRISVALTVLQWALTSYILNWIKGQSKYCFLNKARFNGVIAQSCKIDYKIQYNLTALKPWKCFNDLPHFLIIWSFHYVNSLFINGNKRTPSFILRFS